MLVFECSDKDNITAAGCTNHHVFPCCGMKEAANVFLGFLFKFYLLGKSTENPVLKGHTGLDP